MPKLAHQSYGFVVVEKTDSKPDVAIHRRFPAACSRAQ
jgi:hypothetical protein